MPPNGARVNTSNIDLQCLKQYLCACGEFSEGTLRYVLVLPAILHFYIRTLGKLHHMTSQTGLFCRSGIVVTYSFLIKRTTIITPFAAFGRIS